jgi:hypothetical protein
MISSMEEITFASALELSMGYFHIKLDEDSDADADADAQKLCKVVFPRRMGKYKYKCLHIGIDIP